MPLNKTQISDAEAHSLLASKYTEIENFERIKAGEVSQAFAFTANDTHYVLRMNVKDSGFLKDQYMAEHYNSARLPIPAIKELGSYKHFVYSVSVKAEGKTLDLHTEEINRNLLPQVFRTLNTIHQIPIKGTGIGDWDCNTFNAKFGSYDTWAKNAINKSYWEEIANKYSFFNLEQILKLSDKLESLLPYPLVERYFIHGDYGYNNVVATEDKITGVLDWAEAAYGDFLYDVAWLQFWRGNIDYAKEYQKFNTANLDNFGQRLQICLLNIGISSLEIFAESNREKDYFDTLGIIERLSLQD